MKALTIWQPWASLVAANAKPYEFRKWRTPLRLNGHWIAIHAGARPVVRKELLELVERLRSGDPAGLLIKEIALPLLERWIEEPWLLPLSSIVAKARLQKHIHIRELICSADLRNIDSDRIDHGVYAWPLSDVRAVEPIVPARGAQGFWNWSE